MFVGVVIWKAEEVRDCFWNADFMMTIQFEYVFRIIFLPRSIVEDKGVVGKALRTAATIVSFECRAASGLEMYFMT